MVMKNSHILKFGLLSFIWVTAFFPATAQKVTPITKANQEVGKQVKLFDGSLYYSTFEEKGFKFWAYDLEKKKSKLVMKSDENIGHFFVAGKTLLFSTDKGHPGQDGKLYYLDEHHKPIEIIMMDEAKPDVEPGKGRTIEVYPFRKGFLILAPVRDLGMMYRLYRYKPGNEKDSAKMFFPENYFVTQGMIVSPDEKMIIANVEVTPPHPWENTKAFWNKYSQMFIIHNDDNVQNYEKWMDHAVFHAANFKYTKRTWINLHYKEFKDKGDAVFHHSIFVVTAPSEKKGSMPHHVAEAVDSSLFMFQKKVCYYVANKNILYLVASFEYPTSYQLKYGKFTGHSFAGYKRIYGQFPFDDVLYMVTQHKGDNDYYNVWTLKYKFDTAEWLEAHTFMTVNYNDYLSATLPVTAPLSTFNDTIGNALYLDAPSAGTRKLYRLSKTGTNPIDLNGHEISNIKSIIKYWQGTLIAKQKGQGDTDLLVVNCKTGLGPICSPGDKYQEGYDFEWKGHLFFDVYTAQTKSPINWHSDGTLEGTKRLDLGDLSLHLDFSKPYVAETSIFLWGRVQDKQENRDQLFEMEM